MVFLLSLLKESHYLVDLKKKSELRNENISSLEKKILLLNSATMTFTKNVFLHFFLIIIVLQY